MEPETAAQFEALAERSMKMAQRLNDLNGTGQDDAGLVTATCAPGGRLSDLEFDAKVRRLETHELREAILLATQRAAAEADASMQSLVADFTASAGAGSASSQGLLGELNKHMADAQKVMKEQTERLAAMRDRDASP